MTPGRPGDDDEPTLDDNANHHSREIDVTTVLGRATPDLDAQLRAAGYTWVLTTPTVEVYARPRPAGRHPTDHPLAYCPHVPTDPHEGDPGKRGAAQ